MDTEDRLAKALEEQNRLLRKADRRGGCLWNLIMVILFGVFYLAWLVGKQVVKFVLWAARVLWALLRWIAAKTWAALSWMAAIAAKPFRKEGAN